MKVLGTRVLLEIFEKEEIFDGIVMPDNVEKKRSYIVAGLGEFVDEELEIGDEVLVDKYTGTEIVKGDKKYLIIESAEIIAKIEK